MKKKILAVALCAALLLSVVPFSLMASAAESPEDTSIYLMDVREPGEDGKISYNQQHFAITRWTTTELMLRNSSNTDFGAPWLYSEKIGEENFFKMEYNPMLDTSTRAVVTLMPGNYLQDLHYEKDKNPEKYQALGSGIELPVSETIADAADYKYIALRLKVTGGTKDQLSQFIVHPYSAVEGGGSYDYPELATHTYEGGVLLDINERTVTELGAVTKVDLTYNFDGWIVLPSTAIKSPNKSIAELTRIALEFRRASSDNNWIGRTLYLGDIVALKDLNKFSDYRLDCSTVGHNIVASTPVDPTCTTEGYTPYVCKFCDYSEIRDVLPALDQNKQHSYDAGTPVGATCTEGGYTKQVCTTCGHINKINVRDDAKGHDNGSAERPFLVDEYAAATCHTDGYKYQQCHCGEVIVDETYPMTHTPVITGAVKVTCTTDGNTGTYTCGNPNCTVGVFEQPQPIPALGHTETVVGKKDANCKEAGYTGDTVCEICNQTIKKGTTIAKVASHTFGDWVVTKEATETEDGSKQRQCSVCQTIETLTIPKTGTSSEPEDNTPSTPEDDEPVSSTPEDTTSSEPEDNTSSAPEDETSSTPEDTSSEDGTGDNSDPDGNNNQNSEELSPGTGEDNSSMYIWVILLIVSLGAVVALGIVLMKKKTADKE